MVDETRYAVLECRDLVKFDFDLDTSTIYQHYILCPSCREIGLDPYGHLARGTAWSPVEAYFGPTTQEAVYHHALRDVPKRDAIVVSRGDVLRLGGNSRPFPYVIQQRDDTKRGFTFR